ncbi:hypothetical protein D3C78_1487540 [compost metagenome]
MASINSDNVGTYNISSKTAISLNELIQKISQHKNVEIRARYEDERKGDIVHSCLDNTLAISSMNWKPVYSFDEGIVRTINYYEQCTNIQFNRGSFV